MFKMIFCYIEVFSNFHECVNVSEKELNGHPVPRVQRAEGVVVCRRRRRHAPSSLLGAVAVPRGRHERGSFGSRLPCCSGPRLVEHVGGCTKTHNKCFKSEKPKCSRSSKLMLNKIVNCQTNPF